MFLNIRSKGSHGDAEVNFEKLEKTFPLFLQDFFWYDIWKDLKNSPFWQYFAHTMPCILAYRRLSQLIMNTGNYKISLDKKVFRCGPDGVGYICCEKKKKSLFWAQLKFLFVALICTRKQFEIYENRIISIISKHVFWMFSVLHWKIVQVF